MNNTKASAIFTIKEFGVSITIGDDYPTYHFADIDGAMNYLSLDANDPALPKPLADIENPEAHGSEGDDG